LFDDGLVVWKRLLQVSAAETDALFPHLVGLLTVPEFISAPETTVSVGEVLKAVYGKQLVTGSNAMAIEKAILRIPDARVVLRYEKPESIRNRLLMCIPFDEIQSSEAKAVVARVIEAPEPHAPELGDQQLQLLDLTIARHDQFMLRDNQSFQFGGIQVFEVGKNTTSAIHCRKIYRSCFTV
jgi:hypothetical protein